VLHIYISTTINTALASKPIKSAPLIYGYANSSKELRLS